jgi:leader peptidase (prepilin peptidase) / N-methyltransferase
MSENRAPAAQAEASSGVTAVRAAGYGALGVAACCAFAVSVAAASGPAGWVGGFLALLMIAIVINDWRLQIIPDELTLAAFLLGLFPLAMVSWRESSLLLSAAVCRAVCVAAIFFAFRQVYRWLRSRDGMGLGDVKLAGVAGLWLTWSGLAISVEIAALTAICFYAIRQLIGGRTVSAAARLPFGAFFGPAIWLCWLLEAQGYVN